MSSPPGYFKMGVKGGFCAYVVISSCVCWPICFQTYIEKELSHLNRERALLGVAMVI